MTTEGWIFMVGFRVFDVGLLIVWLIWFFRLRDDGDDPHDDDGGGGEGPGPRPSDWGPDGDGIRPSLGRVPAATRRLRDHSRRESPRRRRGPEPPVPAPLPARVRRPATPAPVHRRASI
jgi:hypothetical protein